MSALRRRETVDGTACPARVYEVWVGGENAYAADLQLAAEVNQRFPLQQTAVNIVREYGTLSVSLLARGGFTQFLDLGSGFPPPSRRIGLSGGVHLSTHEIAQRVQPNAQVVYVDIDPDVVARTCGIGARAQRRPEPVAVLADIIQMRALMERLDKDRLLNLRSPVAVLLHDVLPWIEGDDHVQSLMTDLRELLPTGSAISLSHATRGLQTPGIRQVPAVYRAHGITYRHRCLTLLRALFGAWPDARGGARVAVAAAARYHPEHSRAMDPPYLSSAYAGIGLKPPRVGRGKIKYISSR
ncbi:SAM-dependent methyltransferase [Streptomyces sp. NPDC056254]|uniref:SAM-dependent methyltransferase n=1 Tax=Streptomyces sp. NPDC056254 TaxID=3345763 RepID=UPI0035DED770